MLGFCVVHALAKTFSRPPTDRAFLIAESRSLVSTSHSDKIMQHKYLRAASTKYTFSGECVVLISYPKLHQTEQSSSLRCLLDKHSLFCFISDPENEDLKRKAPSSAALAPPVPPSHSTVQLPPLPPASHPSLQVPAAPSLPPRNIKPISETMWVNISHKVFIFSPFSAHRFAPAAAGKGCLSSSFLREKCLTLLSLSWLVLGLFTISFY